MSQLVSGGRSSNSGLFPCKATASLCRPPGRRAQVRAGGPSWVVGQRHRPLCPTHADPIKNSLGPPSQGGAVPSHLWWPFTSWQRVSPESWLWLWKQPRESSDTALLWMELTSSTLPSLVGEGQGILHEGVRTRLLSTYWMHPVLCSSPLISWKARSSFPS